MSTATFSVRVDSVLKKQAEECLELLGLNMTSAINIYLRQIIRHQAIPFEVSAAPLVPNQETLAAIAEGERIARDPNVKGYRDMTELVKALNS